MLITKSLATKPGSKIYIQCKVANVTPALVLNKLLTEFLDCKTVFSSCLWSFKPPSMQTKEFTLLTPMYVSVSVSYFILTGHAPQPRWQRNWDLKKWVPIKNGWILHSLTMQRSIFIWKYTWKQFLEKCDPIVYVNDQCNTCLQSWRLCRLLERTCAVFATIKKSKHRHCVNVCWNKYGLFQMKRKTIWKYEAPEW